MSVSRAVLSTTRNTLVSVSSLRHSLRLSHGISFIALSILPVCEPRLEYSGPNGATEAILHWHQLSINVASMDYMDGCEL
jgi:hypothetical protein